MNNDFGHNAAEETAQTKQDNHYSDMADRFPSMVGKNWTHCVGCYIRRDHVYDSEMKVWRCGFCGIVNEELTQRKKVEDNPEED